MGLVKKAILKKIASWTGLVAVSFGIGAGIGSGVSYCVSKDQYSTKDYAEDTQIEYIMENLGNDMSYMRDIGGKFLRLAHNDGDPIPVVFEEGFDQRVKDIAIKTLDYGFGLLQDINPLYSYKVVTQKEFDKKGRGVNGIVYNIKPQNELSIPNALAQASSSSVSSNVYRVIDGEISIAAEIVDGISDSGIYYCMLHELMHLFGADDVYANTVQNPDSVVYHNTFIKGNINQWIKHSGKYFTPNDYSNFLSIYTPRCETQEELDRMLEVCREKLKNYEKEYYKGYANEFKTSEVYCGYKFGDCTKIEEIVLNYNLLGDECTIEIKGDTYNIESELGEGDDRIKMSCSGKVLKYNDCMVLRGVSLTKNFMYDKPYKGDFVVFYIRDGKYSTLVRDIFDDSQGFYEQSHIKKTQDNIFNLEPMIAKQQKTQRKRVVDVLEIDGQEYVLEI